MVWQKKLFVFTALFFIGLLSQPLFAQCAMCKATLESGETDLNVSSLNAGIAYLAGFAYMLLSVIGFIWFKHSNYYTPVKERVVSFFKSRKAE